MWIAAGCISRGKKADTDKRALKGVNRYSSSPPFGADWKEILPLHGMISRGYPHTTPSG
ncbi:MAG: hypothetical protein LUH22_17790 [Bacteroides sp.]|nr:hypothetical protein [Bacteroides sp.]